MYGLKLVYDFEAIPSVCLYVNLRHWAKNKLTGVNCAMNDL